MTWYKLELYMRSDEPPVTVASDALCNAIGGVLFPGRIPEIGFDAVSLVEIAPGPNEPSAG